MSGMSHIDYWFGAFHSSAFASIPAGEKRELASVYQDLLKAGKLAAYWVHERFYEIGSSEGLRGTSEFLDAMHQCNKDWFGFTLMGRRKVGQTPDYDILTN